jgi:hypothetical protein
MRGITLPEFSSTKKVDELLACVYDHESAYDMIIGNDFLLPIGFDFLLSIRSMKWHDSIVPWKPLSYFNDPSHEGVANEAHCFFVDSDLDRSIDETFPAFFANAGKIKESLHEARLRKWCNNKHT